MRNTVHSDDAYLNRIASGDIAEGDQLGAMLFGWRVAAHIDPTPFQVRSNEPVHDPTPSGALRWTLVALIVLATVLVLVLAGCGTPTPASSELARSGSAAAESTMTTAPPTEIPIGTIAPPYTSASFPHNWGHTSGCTTRQVVIATFSGPNAVDTDNDGCKDDGWWLDPYTGARLTAATAQIDHVYSKEEAWRRGAWRWTPDQRAVFFNYQPNLLPVASAANEAKGSKGPDAWRPRRREAWCQYATIYRVTAAHFQLDVSPSENAALDEMTAACGH